MHARHPHGLTSEQATIAIRHQHDDGRVRAREVLRVATRIGANAHMAGLRTFRLGPAHAAKAMARVPVKKAPLIGEDRTFLLSEKRAEAAQIGKFSPKPGSGDCRTRLFDVRKVEGEKGSLLDKSEQHHMRGAVHKIADLRDTRQQGRRALLGALDGLEEVLSSPNGHYARARVAQPSLEPVGLAAQVAHPVEPAMGVEIGAFHALERRTGKAGVQSDAGQLR